MTKAELIEENAKLRSYLEKILEATSEEGINKLIEELRLSEHEMGYVGTVGIVKALARIALMKG